MNRHTDPGFGTGSGYPLKLRQHTALLAVAELLNSKLGEASPATRDPSDL